MAYVPPPLQTLFWTTIYGSGFNTYLHKKIFIVVQSGVESELMAARFIYRKSMSYVRRWPILLAF